MRSKPAHELYSKTTFGFWLYLMTDCVVFASLFATYGVLRNNTAGGPDGNELFDLWFVLVETLLLLVSSLTAGLALLYVRAGMRRDALTWMAITFISGAGFLALELYEFAALIGEGYSWQTSGFLTSYFTLVGTHGLHIAVGLLWLGVLIVRAYQNRLTPKIVQQFTLFSLFWHFLDIVWILIFSLVYLMGAR